MCPGEEFPERSLAETESVGATEGQFLSSKRSAHHVLGNGFAFFVVKPIRECTHSYAMNA